MSFEDYSYFEKEWAGYNLSPDMRRRGYPGEKVSGMDKMTVGEARKGHWSVVPSAWEHEKLMSLADQVEDQRIRWLADNPDTADPFKPLDQCTKDELLAELNSTEFRAAGGITEQG
jgi:hypothetical protein